MSIDLPRLIPPDMDAELESEIYRIPQHCREGLLAYLRYGIMPGHFLQAVLSNDLKDACGRADEVNQAALYQYVFVLHNFCPAASWGSPEAVRAWVERGLELRRTTYAEEEA